jgi:arylsulfatase A-like enzyme
MQKKIPLIALAILLVPASVIYFRIINPGEDGTTGGVGVRYNVLVIVSDAMRRDVIGCYGGGADTPNINRLAENGVLFENAYSTSPWTAPSSVGMFTGNYATTYGFDQLINTVQIFVPQSEHLFAEYLKEQGYMTRMLIENDQASIHGNLQGFESLPEFKQFEQAASPQRIERIESITGTELINLPAYKNSFIVLNHLLNMPPDSNFFTLHWMEDPHCPYSPAGKFRSRIEVDPAELSKPEKHYSACIKEAPAFTPPEREYVQNLYAAEVESVDERVGFVLDVLAEKRLMDDTIIIFTSDHGELFGEHGRYGHGWFGHDCHYYENLIRVPLIIAGANLPKGERRDNYVSLLDLMPTLRDLLSANHAGDMQGQSLRPILFNSPAENRTLYFDDVREHDQVDALISDHLKLICFEGDRYEMYDIRSDAEEANDIASARPQIARALYEQLLQIREDNKIRRAENEVDFDASTDILDVNRKKMIEKLKSLGYIE